MNKQELLRELMRTVMLFQDDAPLPASRLLDYVRGSSLSPADAAEVTAHMASKMARFIDALPDED
jgi:uncharacterized protein (UPF0264 family)